MSLPTSRTFITQLLNSIPSPEQASTVPNPLTSVPDTARKQLLALHVLFPNEFLPALDLLDRRLVTRLCICDDAPEKSFATPQTANVAHPSASANAPVNDVPHAQGLNNNGANVQTTLAQPTIGQTPTTALPTGPPELNSPTQTSRPTADSNNPDEASLNPSIAIPPDPNPISSNTVYYVRSAQQKPSRYTSNSSSSLADTTATATASATTPFYEVRLQAWNCSCPAFAFSSFPPVHPDPPPTFTPATSSIEEVLLRSDSHPGEGGGKKREKAGEWMFGGCSLGEDTSPPVCKHILACVLGERCALFGGFVEERSVGVFEGAGWGGGWGG